MVFLVDVVVDGGGFYFGYVWVLVWLDGVGYLGLGGIGFGDIGCVVGGVFIF